MKRKDSLVVGLFFLMVIALAVAATIARADEIAEPQSAGAPAQPADWFTQRARTYGWNTLTYEFYQFEDHSGYIVTTNIAYTDGAFFIDEYVDLNPEYADQMDHVEAFSEEIIWWLNEAQCDMEAFFPAGAPQDFGDHTNNLHELLVFCNADRTPQQIFMPMIINN